MLDKKNRCSRFYPESRIKRTLFGVHAQVLQEESVSGHPIIDHDLIKIRFGNFQDFSRLFSNNGSRRSRFFNKGIFTEAIPRTEHI